MKQQSLDERISAAEERASDRYWEELRLTEELKELRDQVEEDPTLAEELCGEIANVQWELKNLRSES